MSSEYCHPGYADLIWAPLLQAWRLGRAEVDEAEMTACIQATRDLECDSSGSAGGTCAALPCPGEPCTDRCGVVACREGTCVFGRQQEGDPCASPPRADTSASGLICAELGGEPICVPDC